SRRRHTRFSRDWSSDVSLPIFTLGVADLAASRAFYGRLGWQEHGDSQPGVAFFQMHGMVLALFGAADLAADQGRPEAVLGTGAKIGRASCRGRVEMTAVGGRVR